MLDDVEILDLHPKNHIKSDTCPICSEIYHEQHRVVSLRCGHLFGQQCVERWLEQSNRCPECNQSNCLEDLRIIYGKTIVCIDTDELVRAKKELDEANKKLKKERLLRKEYEEKFDAIEDSRRKCDFYEKIVDDLKFDLVLKESENVHLKKEIRKKIHRKLNGSMSKVNLKDELVDCLNGVQTNDINKLSTKEISDECTNQINLLELNSQQDPNQPVEYDSFEKQPLNHLKTIDLESIECRLMAKSEFLGYLIISQSTKVLPSTSSPTTSSAEIIKNDPEYGIRIVSWNNYSSIFLPLHDDEISDICPHPSNAFLVTSSLDKSVKLVDLITKQELTSFQLSSLPLKVTWNQQNVALFYVGMENGHLMECNSIAKTVIRQIDTHLSAPIRQIIYLNFDEKEEQFNLLIKANDVLYFCKVNNESSTLTPSNQTVFKKSMPITSEIISTDIIGEQASSDPYYHGNMLLVVRSDTSIQHYQHYVCDFKIIGNGIYCNQVKQYHCSHESVSANTSNSTSSGIVTDLVAPDLNSKDLITLEPVHITPDQTSSGPSISTISTIVSTESAMPSTKSLFDHISSDTSNLSSVTSFSATNSDQGNSSLLQPTSHSSLNSELPSTSRSSKSSFNLISSKLFKNPSGNSSYFVCGSDDRSAFVWLKNEEKPIQKFNTLMIEDEIVDFELYRADPLSEPVLALLTGSCLYLYEWTDLV